MASDTYLSVRQVGARLSVSVASVWRWARTEDFPKPVKLSAGCTRWRSSDIDAFVAQREGRTAA